MTGDDRLHFAVLGSFRVSRDGQQVDLGPRLQRALLAILVLEAGHVVPVDRLIDLLWREDPPAAALASVQAYISQLRRVLEPGRLARASPRVLVTQDPGYLLRVGDDQVDALRFGALARQAHEDLAAGQAAAAAAGLADALALWRGDPLAEFAAEPWAVPAVTRLTEAHDLAAEDRIDAALALGGHAQAAAELEAMVAAQPLRERRWGQLILATYRCGRQADALRAYQRCRTVLADELGLEPGPGLRRLQGAVLAQDPSLDWNPPSAAAVMAPPGAVPGHARARPAGSAVMAERSDLFLGNLPAQVSSFIGRGRELSDVRALVGSSRLVTLTGAGGSGKTRLSVQVAAELLDGSGDGVWLVELAAVSDPDAVPSAISKVLGIAGQPGRPVLEGLLDALASQDILIVLDNCEHLIGACAKTADAVLRRCPRVHLLATSREPLAIGGETIYRVPPLSLPGPGDDDSVSPGSSDAVALFMERAREQGVGLSLDEETAPLLVSICRRLDGLPLAIELAAARLRSLSLTGLRDRLDQRFGLLTGGSRAALQRQQTLRATVEWSYSLLSGAEQSLLRRLSVFAESFDLDAAEAVCGTGEIEAFDVTHLLGSLVDKSLVVAEPTGGAVRYRLLETIRQFAAERLAEAGEEAAAATAAAHREYFLRIAEAAAPHLTGPDLGRWLGRLDADHANLWRAAERAASDPNGTARVLRFAVALQRYWLARERNRQPLRLLLPVLERPEARADPALYGAALVTATATAIYIDITAARQFGEQAVELARRLHDDRLLTNALTMLSTAYRVAGEPGRGLPLGQESVERARQLGDDTLLGHSLRQYLCFTSLIEPAQYAHLVAEATACAERSGDQLLFSGVHNNAGVAALRAGDIQAARAHLEQAAEAAHAVGQETEAVEDNLGWLRREEGDRDSARSAFETALRTSRRRGEETGIPYPTLGLACLAADLGDWHRAAALHGAAQALLARSGEQWEEPFARWRRDSLADAHARLGDEQFDRAYAKGTALSPGAAFRLALTQPDRPVALLRSALAGLADRQAVRPVPAVPRGGQRPGLGVPGTPGIRPLVGGSPQTRDRAAARAGRTGSSSPLAFARTHTRADRRGHHPARRLDAALGQICHPP